MRKIYMLIAIFAFAGMMNAQVLVDTDFSELRSQVALGHQDQRNIEDALPITGGKMHWRGPRYNDTGAVPSIGVVGGGTVIGETGDAVPLDPNDVNVNYMRVGSNTALTDGVPTNHFYAITPTNEFVNGGKITLTVSVHGTAAGINVYNVTDATLLGTIDISGITTYKYQDVEFTLPAEFSGIKTIGFTRALTDGEITGGVTFFTWNVKIETNGGSSGPTVVGYFTLQKNMHETATTVAEDPLIEFLKADPKFTVVENILTSVAITDVHDLSGYDVVVVQESIGGNDGILKPGGALALADINKPFLYNKSYAFIGGRAFAAGATGGGREGLGLNILVAPENQGNDLFKGLTFEANNEAQLFHVLTNDGGEAGATNSIKSLNYARNVVISGDNTLLGQPATLQPDDVATVSFNDIPAGRVIGDQTLAARMITIGYNFGAISANEGRNMTQAGLTVFRNAMYILAGLDVPATLADYPVPSSIKVPVVKGNVVGVEYYNISGVKMGNNWNMLPAGIYIEVKTYDSGATSTDKILKSRR